MEHCPICKSPKQDFDSLCLCGYDFKEQEILDTESLRNYFSKLRRGNQWIEEVISKKKVNEVQKKKHGRWSIKRTADLLGVGKSNTSAEIKLAKALDEYPQLSKCKNKSEAHRC